MKSQHQQPTDRVLEDIAKEHLRVPTLETRKSDSLDFHDSRFGNCAQRSMLHTKPGIVAAEK